MLTRKPDEKIVIRIDRNQPDLTIEFTILEIRGKQARVGIGVDPPSKDTVRIWRGELLDQQPK